MFATEQWFSHRLQTDIALARWGGAGVPVLVFPTAGGDAEEVGRHHLVAHCGELLDAGRVRIYSCDSVAGRTMVERVGDTAYRMRMFNEFHKAVADEVVPAIHADSGGPQPIVLAGASIGAFNALGILCRFPRLFRTAICMSGTYDIAHLIGGDVTEDLYFATPGRFVPGLQGPDVDALRQRFVILAHGRGRWEDPEQSWNAAKWLGDKGIPNRVDEWGTEYDHDWPTWWKMLPQYLDEVL